MYELNMAQARKADSTSSSITDAGRYSGHIESAYKVTSKKGAKGVGFVFKSTAGEKAAFTLYTHAPNGDQIMGYDALMALMTVCSLRSINPVSGTRKQWDYDTRKEIEVKSENFNEFTSKKVDILFQTEDYLTNEGQVKTKVAPRFFLNSAGFSATEILDKKTEAKQGEAMLKALRHKPLKNEPRPTQQTNSTGFDDMPNDFLDDNPF